MSRRTLLNLTLALALAGLLGLHLALAPRPTERNLELLPEMVDSVPYDAFAASPVFADGKTLQAPPEGTIPRGLPPLHFSPGAEEAARAGRELANPLALPVVLAADAAPPPPIATSWEAEQTAFGRDLAAGEEVYGIYCGVCHGATGAGDGPVARRGFPAPPSLLAENARGMADGRMFHLITYGGENMPAYAAQTSRGERWQAILYVRELQRRGPVVADPDPPPPAGVGAGLGPAVAPVAPPHPDPLPPLTGGRGRHRPTLAKPGVGAGLAPARGSADQVVTETRKEASSSPTTGAAAPEDRS